VKQIPPSARGNPFQSKLEPFADLIRDWRRRRKSYRLIAQMLRDEHGVVTDHTSIWSYVKVRSRSRPVYTMTEDAVRKHPTPSVLDPIARLKAKPVVAPKAPIFEYDENKPLTLINEKHEN
jgi:hypothetical protein